MLRRAIARLRKRGAPSDDEIARELRDHLELDAESFVSSGAAPDARFLAQRRFGNMTNVSEAVRDVWRWTWLEQLAQDLRHGVRAIAHSPLYAAAVVITLAMGIGAASSVYSLSRAIHNPFPRLPSDRLLSITHSTASCPTECTEVSPAALAALRTRAPSIIAIGAANSRLALRTANGSEPLSGYAVSPNTFEAIDAPFAAGRGFSKDAGQPDAPKFVVLSYDFWQRRFGGSRGVIDSTITLGERPFTVTGVLAKDVVFPTAADAYTPFVLGAGDRSNYGARQYAVFARIAPGATFATAVAEVNTVGQQLARESPRTDSGWVLRARPIATYHTDDVSILVQISGIAALLVFLAACMSAANLALSRLATRRHELALRTALGVRRARRLGRPRDTGRDPREFRAVHSWLGAPGSRRTHVGIRVRGRRAVDDGVRRAAGAARDAGGPGSRPVRGRTREHRRRAQHARPRDAHRARGEHRARAAHRRDAADTECAQYGSRRCGRAARPRIGDASDAAAADVRFRSDRFLSPARREFSTRARCSRRRHHDDDAIEQQLLWRGLPRSRAAAGAERARIVR